MLLSLNRRQTYSCTEIFNSILQHLIVNKTFEGAFSHSNGISSTAKCKAIRNDTSYSALNNFSIANVVGKKKFSVEISFPL